MNSRKSSGKTAQELISAAGRLFAARGIDAVTTRDISMEAGGIDISLIKYHFGNKDGLIQAVAEYAMTPLRKCSLEEYFEENQGLLATWDGQRAFVTGMVEVMFNRFNTVMPEEWCRGFVLQVLRKQEKNTIREMLIEQHMKPMVSVFVKVYQQITGNQDFETAFCWYLFITAQLFIYSGDSDLIDLLHPGEKTGAGFGRRLQYFCTQQVLNGFHLA